MLVTLDTNEFIRALMRPPQLATLVMAWESDRFVVVCSEPLLEEYEYVLAYPEVAPLIQPELLRAYRSHLREAMQIILLSDIPHICRDPHDDKVIATAAQGHVELLLTEDNDLRAPEIIEYLAQQGIAVLSTGEFLTRLDRKAS